MSWEKCPIEGPDPVTFANAVAAALEKIIAAREGNPRTIFAISPALAQPDVFDYSSGFAANVDAQFMAENSSSGVQTRHNDTQYHILRKNIKDGFIEVVFVRSCKNVGDTFAKNVNKDIYVEYMSKFLKRVNDDLDG